MLIIPHLKNPEEEEQANVGPSVLPQLWTLGQMSQTCILPSGPSLPLSL